MSSNPNSVAPPKGRAESAFREAFDRLKRGKPDILPKGTPVSQNNVAKEAGCDPSALRKSRFPSLIAEIQRWIAEHAPDAPQSLRQTMLAQRGRNRSLREKIEALKIERDHAFSLLVEADAKIIDLIMENIRLQSHLPPSNVTPMQGRKPQKDV